MNVGTKQVQGPEKMLSVFWDPERIEVIACKKKDWDFIDRLFIIPTNKNLGILRV